MKNFLLRITLLIFSSLIIGFFLYILFKPIFYEKNIIFTFAITPFDIAQTYPKIWDFIKKLYFILAFISYFIIFNYLYNTFQKYISYKKKSHTNHTEKKDLNTNSFKLLIGKNCNNEKIYLDESGLYQNMLITGTIGTRKNFFSYVPFYFTNNII